MKVEFQPNNFSTSVSCEPFLDEAVVELVNLLSSYVTDSIWIGKANYLIRRLKINGYNKDELTMLRAEKILTEQSDENILKIYNCLKDNQIVKWKESIKKVVDIKIATIKGLDI